MKRPFALIGVPSAAGAHSAGVEKAPAALRAAGLVERLRGAGLEVSDHGSLPLVPFRLDREHPRAQNVGLVAEVARGLERRVRYMTETGELPLVIGGDCTILLGALAGHEAREGVGVVYLDAHPDLNTPGNVAQGALDWMGMAHALGVPGALPELVHVGARDPLLTWGRVVFLSYVESATTPGELLLLDQHRPLVYPSAVVARRARDVATVAARALEQRVDRFIVHFDVDALDFVQFPIADNAYQRNEGLSLDDAMEALAALAASAGFGGLVLTEVNPDHAAGQGPLLEEFADRLGRALAGGR